MNLELSVRKLGVLAYEEAWLLQQELRDKRILGEIGDHLLFVTHPPVITVGRKKGASNEVLGADTTPVISIERGGGATYHGPGQLVAYPIVHLVNERRDLSRFLRALEQSIIDALGPLGLSGDRVDGLTGVWVNGRKIASIGIAVKRWVTYHGLALNVTTPQSAFTRLNPCGLDASVMTSIARELDQEEVDWPTIEDRIAASIAGWLGLEVRN